MVARCGYIPVPRSTLDYVELLPAQWRRINQEGVTLDNRVYDAAALNPYRQADSGVKAQNGRWELHHDPYDVTAVWIRNHHHGGWITAAWIHRDLVAQPFSAAIYEHVRAATAAAGEPVRDDYIARRVAEMLDPDKSLGAHSPADQRMVARERNNPARASHLSVVTNAQDPAGEPGNDGPPAASTTVKSTADVAEGRNRKGRKVVGFEVFDPTSDDWRFR